MLKQNNKSKSVKTGIPPIDYDGAWKKLLELHLQMAIEFFLPEIAQKINFKKGFTFLEDELTSFNINKSTSRVDKLIKFELKNKKNLILLLHIEIQSSKPKTISKRMYEYAQKIINAYPNSEFLSFLLYLGDEHFQNINYYCPFTISKAISYQGEYFMLADHSEAKLLENGSPIALLLYLTKLINKHKKGAESRFRILKNFYVLLEKKGISGKIFKNLIFLAKILVTLPPILKNEYKKFLTKKNKKMATYHVSAAQAKELTNIIPTMYSKGKTITQLIKEGRSDGEQIGIQKTQTEGIIKALKMNLLSIDQISQLFEVPTDFVLKIKNDRIQ